MAFLIDALRFISTFAADRDEEFVKIYVRNALTTAEKKFSSDKSYILIRLIC